MTTVSDGYDGYEDIPPHSFEMHNAHNHTPSTQRERERFFESKSNLMTKLVLAAASHNLQVVLESLEGSAFRLLEMEFNKPSLNSTTQSDKVLFVNTFMETSR
ncbi:hypothetical protein CEXT_82771 [Caerostris extrusa]|uniref:Uncharacterized protein n=1 Tax=Caerostris extrusa TaxID=172846 RepID=A0AAV4XHF4_CAEEX|nr:hypothetical protein CEXT_82771 [Caerostris extrusa]